MKADLHTHTNLSDGTDTPSELVQKAAEAGLDMVAITDHDTCEGWTEAFAAGRQHNIQVLGGIEVSTKNHGKGVHLLSWGFDPTNPELNSILTAGRRAREERIPLMLQRLQELGYPVDYDYVLQAAGTGVIGRPHIAQGLIAAGWVANMDEAFTKFLGPTGAAWVIRPAVDIEQAIAVLNQAGGACVLAHPWGRGSNLTEERIGELKEVGLAGLEVHHVEHDDEQQAALAQLATKLDLVITGSSDYHGTRKTRNPLGRYTTDTTVVNKLLEHTTNYTRPAQ